MLYDCYSAICARAVDFDVFSMVRGDATGHDISILVGSRLSKLTTAAREAHWILSPLWRSQCFSASGKHCARAGRGVDRVDPAQRNRPNNVDLCRARVCHLPVPFRITKVRPKSLFRSEWHGNCHAWSAARTLQSKHSGQSVLHSFQGLLLGAREKSPATTQPHESRHLKGPLLGLVARSQSLAAGFVQFPFFARATSPLLGQYVVGQV